MKSEHVDVMFVDKDADSFDEVAIRVGADACAGGDTLAIELVATRSFNRSEKSICTLSCLDREDVAAIRDLLTGLLEAPETIELV